MTTIATQAESLLTVSAAAARIGVSPSTIRRWVRDGHLRSCKFGDAPGAALRIHPEDLDSSIEAARRGPEAAA